MLNNLSNSTLAAVDVTTAPVTVPQDYLGFHFHRYPTDFMNRGLGASPAPSFSFGACRTVDNDGQGYWRGQNPANGVYDWTGLDLLINAMPGKTITYTLAGTPQWCVSAIDQTKRGPWYNFGECGMPTNMAYVTTFLSALFTRYAGKIKYFEIWNEPDFAQDYTGFWWGSTQDLLLLAKTCYEWIKANHPSVIVLSPGFTDWFGKKALETSAYRFLNTTLTSTGKKGHEYCDYIAFHPYTMFYSGTTATRGWANTCVDIRYNYLESMLSLNSILGTNKPLIVSEFGVDSSIVGNLIPYYYSLSGEEQATLMWRLLAYCAVRGIKGFYIYSYDSGLSGAWCTYDGRTETKELTNMINDFHNKISGKTINSCQRFNDGRLLLNMSTGEQYCF